MPDTTHSLVHSTEVAWAAGFFDGEGHVSRDKKGYAQVCVAQARLEPLERFRATVGMGKIYGPYQRKTWKPLWHWKVYRDEEVKQLRELLWDYLSEPKREQFNEAS